MRTIDISDVENEDWLREASKLPRADADPKIGLTIAAAHAVRRAGQLAAEAWRPAEVERAAAAYARRADDWNKKELGKQVQKALGVPLEAIERPTQDRIPAFVVENVALIKTVPERALDRVGALAEEALATGMTAEAMADRLQEIGEISETDAMRIARDQIGKLVAQVNVDRQKALGVTRAIWRTMKDNRVRDEHVEREGQEFDLDEGIDGEFPGSEIQCFPGETNVSLHADVFKAYRRLYRGELTTLVTDSGESIRCTPNHPVLTQRGWVAAHLIDVGDYVFRARSQCVEGLVDDPERSDASIAEIFSALATFRVPHQTTLFGGGFHGDAAVNEQVDVVDVDGLLRFELDPSVSQSLCQDLLARADASTLYLSHSYLALVKHLGPTDCGVRGASKLLTLLGSHSFVPRFHGGGQSTYLHTLADELRANGRSADVEALSKSLDAAAFGVEPRYALARVVFGVVRRAMGVAFGSNTTGAQELGESVALTQVHLEGSGDLGDRQPLLEQPCRVVKKMVSEAQVHVYNLETSSGWYVAQNLIVSNCRCYSEPVFDFASEALSDE